MPTSASQRLQRRDALQHRIEFRALGELVLLDDLAREIARQHELHLAGHRLGVERAAAPRCCVAVRPQEDVLAAVDQDARFGLVARRDEIDDGDGCDERQHRRHDDPAALARERAARARADRCHRIRLALAAQQPARACFDLGCQAWLRLGLETARSMTALSLPARQNAKRIEHSRRERHSVYLNGADYTPLRLLLG